MTTKKKTTPVSIWILGDQLLENHPAVAYAEEEYSSDQIRIVLVESSQRTGKIPYQRKKLVLLFSAMRHYAEALRDKDYTVDYICASSAGEGLREHIAEHGSEQLITMAAAEYSGRQFQQERLASYLDIEVEILLNTQFLVGRFDPYAEKSPEKRTVMENFYRDMRRHFGILMEPEGAEDGDPAGGEWNFDKENRKPYPKKGLEPPSPISFEPDEITQAVMKQVADIPDAIGTVEGFNLAVTHAEAEAAFDDFIEQRMEKFGPYEDAMSAENGILFHSLLSPYMNIGLLDPLEMAQRAEQAYRDEKAPINSVEGFVRQVIGWREYIFWHYWAQMPDLLTANAWGHTRSIPDFFWSGETEMACLSTVINRVIDTGYSHHIERLMIICNFCMLAGIDPAEVNQWFLSFYVDAYEWVVTPNVIGMGLNADGGKTATKPYVSSANYINKMSNFCKGCELKHTVRTGEGACPFNYLYWNFLIKNEDELRSNPRSGRAVLGLRHLDDEERQTVQKQAKEFLGNLEPYD